MCQRCCEKSHGTDSCNPRRFNADDVDAAVKAELQEVLNRCESIHDHLGDVANDLESRIRARGEAGK
jgi:ElaB/YqjD/DUF883 family membrane-anchored ribosome-binding protein